MLSANVQEVYMELRVFSDLETFLANGPAWDDLWYRSSTILPTARAELVAHWLKHFAPTTRFCALAVAEGDRLVAGLPLVQRRIKGLFPAADLPSNPWATNGELLLDESADAAKVLNCLCQGLRQIGWPLLWMDMVPAQTRRWQIFLQEAQKVGLSTLVHWRYPVGIVHLPEDFSTYWASRSAKLQKKIRNSRRQLEETSGVPEIRLVCEATPLQWEKALDQAWQIEDASWKGQAGSSVLRTPGMREFYLEQTRILAQWGCARLAFLEVASRPMAFLFGWEAKGVFQGLKIGYDPAFARFSPGHLSWYLFCQTLIKRGNLVTVDFLGPLLDAHRQWATGSYPIGRVIIASNWWAKSLLACYRAYRRLRGRATEPDWLSTCTASAPEPLEPKNLPELLEHIFS